MNSGETSDQVQISQKISKHTWIWIGHILTKQNSIDREVLDWNAQGRRKRSRLKAGEKPNKSTKPEEK